MFINGTSFGNASTPGKVLKFNTIGYGTNIQDYNFNGRIDEVIIFNKIL